ncbi:citrate synthase [Nesterenkonia muleiensis]|uniref:citrate synthase n=1 Tax=Nesterenkonia muleiensis TaxID=2282648 RepID=UPI000E70CBB1|nr:citrate synthase [Nesterenkonia muleiensis]
MNPADEPRLLTSDEVAGRLGIKVETLYAYVSRGQLARVRSPEGSRFRPLDVEEFAARRKPRSVFRRGSVAARPLVMLDTDLAMVEDDELYLRGQRASDLVKSRPVERVAAWIWSGDWETALSPPTAKDLAQTMAFLQSLPAGASRIDQLNLSAAGLGMSDPWREEISPEALQRAGARFLLGVPRLLLGGHLPPEEHTVAEVLWRALSPHPPQPQHIRALNAALVLTIDHDLAISTLSGRIAASGRASGYSVITSALGAFASPLHGNASVSAALLVRSVLDGHSAERALGEAISTTGARLPGFGHFLYADGDSRARTLLQFVPGLPRGSEVSAAVDALTEEVAQRSQLRPNVDLALAAVTVAGDMNDSDGSLLFGLGRSVGWIAHAISEYAEKPLRLRPQGRYTGP